MSTFPKYIQNLLLIAIIIVINIIGSYVYFDIDLTEDKRFTISPSSEEVIESLDDPMTIKILLDGEFPSGFKRLQASVKDFMDKIRDVNPNISYLFEDPSEGSIREQEQKMRILQEDNIIPVSLNYRDGDEFVQKAVFPFAIITYKNKKQIVNLLEEQKPGDDEEVILNNSIALLEYKIVNAIKLISASKTKNILFIEGHGEWDSQQTFRIESELRKFHDVRRIALDSMMRLDSTIDLVIVAGPKQNMKLQDQFKLDQYIMDGGNIIWLIDKFYVSLDSINFYKYYVPPVSETGLDDLFFKYGIRILPDLIMDLECSHIPQVIGMAGDKPQTKLFPWYYHLAISPSSKHPIVKNINRVNLFFPSTIDTIQTEGRLTKTILLSSSKYSRSQLAPMRLTFEILKQSPDPTKFNNGNKPTAVLVEGEFTSFFTNRLTPEVSDNLRQLGIKFKENSKPAKQLFVSDSEFLKNLINTNNGLTEDIGYNKWELQYYKGNKDFILNAIEYMLNDESILASRSKEIKLRLLDAVKTKDQKTLYQFINVGLPVILLLVFGIIYQFIRKQKYAV